MTTRTLQRLRFKFGSSESEAYSLYVGTNHILSNALVKIRGATAANNGPGLMSGENSRRKSARESLIQRVTQPASRTRRREVARTKPVEK
jgi:hypothetical protein